MDKTSFYKTPMNKMPVWHDVWIDLSCPNTDTPSGITYLDEVTPDELEPYISSAEPCLVTTPDATINPTSM